MNYEESALILEEIDKAKKILLNCHTSPDGDSAGSSLALAEVLRGIGKEVKIICPDELPNLYSFADTEKTITKIDFTNFDFKPYELLICLDTASYDGVTGNKDIQLPQIPTIIIDHHYTNTGYGKINIVDSKAGSAAEVLFKVLKDWGVQINKSIATNLLLGILTDTGVYQYPGATSSTFEISKELLDCGADKDLLILNTVRSYSSGMLTYWGHVLSNMKVNEEYKFVYSSVDYSTYRKCGNPAQAKGIASSMFSCIVKNTDFGIVMQEDESGNLDISLRARTNFDTSVIAQRLGGGGHKAASAATLKGLDYEDAVERVLSIAKVYVEEIRKQN